MYPARVFAAKHVALEIGVGRSGTKPFQMRLASGGKLGLIGVDVAIGTFKNEHGSPP
jgi:hypothetical protein